MGGSVGVRGGGQRGRGLALTLLGEPVPHVSPLPGKGKPKAPSTTTRPPLTPTGAIGFSSFLKSSILIKKDGSIPFHVVRSVLDGANSTARH